MTSTATSGPGRRERKRGNTRTTILATAHQLFELHGFAATPVTQIAVEADVAVQTVFNHFPAKQDLFFEGRCSWLRLAQVVLPELRAAADPGHGVCLDDVAAAVDAMVGAHLRVMASPGKDIVLRELAEDRTLRSTELEMRDRAETALVQTLSAGCSPAARDDARRLAALWTADTWVEVTDGRRALLTPTPAGAPGRRPLRDRLLQLSA
ncbi:TetR/AcrR family transcriptional regulator [Modestobacter sp. Leaf380]|uniref:TetR/AcrR family transcriptional regulator n=1 Tax=Modestobacter sp. Leaf380 TaxID=1736356 RepID=UPI0006FE1924|nr:TetR/AcrR family transcriptional regulator [Modestobacter sp. Leaf380]KQS65850.1 hypothetical protein ASG41_14895 [Modestobacter sp. Leaf380]